MYSIGMDMGMSRVFRCTAQQRVHRAEVACTYVCSLGVRLNGNEHDYTSGISMGWGQELKV